MTFFASGRSIKSGLFIRLLFTCLLSIAYGPLNTIFSYYNHKHTIG